MLVCYLCGTQHGLNSLAIHQKQCLMKHANRAKAENDDFLPPQPPAMAPPCGHAASVAAVQKYNMEAQAVYNASMPTCATCGRSFETAEKLKSHAMSCKASKGASNPSRSLCDDIRCVHCQGPTMAPTSA